VVCIGPEFGILYECTCLLVWEHLVEERRVQYHSILRVFHGLDSWRSSSRTILVPLPTDHANNSSFAPDISKAKSSAINVNRLIERQPQIDAWSGKGKHIKSLDQGHLQFKDVHFRYPTRPHVPVLRGLDIEVKPGQYVALVGSSGCGKSTAVALIERFYDPLIGEVLVDGVPVKEYNLTDFRRSLSLVSQEPTCVLSWMFLTIVYIKGQ